MSLETIKHLFAPSGGRKPLKPSRVENGVSVPYFHFEPQPDITAYELALLINALVSHTEDFTLRLLSKAPYEVFRHFAHGDELRKMAYRSAGNKETEGRGASNDLP